MHYASPGIHVDAALTSPTNLNMVTPLHGNDPIQHNNAPCHNATTAQEWYEEYNRVQGFDLAFKFHRSHFDGASGKPNLRQGGPTSQEFRDLLLTSWSQVPR